MVWDLVSIGVVQMVLVMRTHALYQNRKLLIWLTLSCFVSLALTLSACWLMAERYETFLPVSVNLLERGCLPVCLNSFCRPLFVILWIPFALFETGIFLLTAWKFHQLSIKAEIKGFPQIIHVIMRDGLMYYIVILSVAVANLIVWITYPAATLLAVGLLKSLQVTICSRRVVDDDRYLTWRIQEKKVYSHLLT
ncbi:hypothetical protein HYPSUDRAFT_859632 [Hypholoma sublateritium FD-334 SS-4]|uniref:Uncharacterized protein n=1 Tax=Hypholoma sublateritium (strain FD-334 SS-4) TaxID=945553 RepID=A0A0D2PHR5_HYPSF|nr:hypothetical protein HYPSUDRAFT_859632 [Hypholoma sublateritium FD-334 SS-4]